MSDLQVRVGMRGRHVPDRSVALGRLTGHHPLLDLLPAELITRFNRPCKLDLPPFPTGMMIYVRLLSTIIFLIVASPAHAQQEEASTRAQHDAECRLAAQVLTQARPANERERAMATLPRCPIEGADAAARLWYEPPSDTMGLYRLRQATQHTRDQRVVNALMRAARSASHPPLVRKFAMLQLLTYLDPSDATLLETLDPANYRGRVISRVSHPVTLRDGPQPLSDSYQEELIEFYRSLAENDADPAIRYAAGVLLRNAEEVPTRITAPS